MSNGRRVVAVSSLISLLRNVFRVSLSYPMLGNPCILHLMNQYWHSGGPLLVPSSSSVAQSF